MTKRQDDIKELEKKISEIEADIEIEEHDIDRYSKICQKNGISKKVINDFIKATETTMNIDSSDSDIASAQAVITDYLKAFGGENFGRCMENLQGAVQAKCSNEEDLKVLKADLKELKSDANKTVKEIAEETAAIVEQEGHLYPVKMVTWATAKLKQYNAQLESFMNNLNTLNVNIDVSWLCQKVEAFCRRINNALALLRYQIVKGLSKVFEQANIFKQYIDPIANFNPTDIFSCLGWVKNVIKYFLGPYMVVVQFIQDFMTYTPPLVSEAAKLVVNTAAVPVVVASKLDVTLQTKKKASEENEKKQGGKPANTTISKAVDDEVQGKASSESAVSSAVNKEVSGDDTDAAIVEMYKDDMEIKFEPITLGDVMGGGAEEPKPKENATKAKKKDLYEKQAKTDKQLADKEWNEMVSEIQRVHDYDNGNWFSAYPEKLRNLEGSGWFTDKICTGTLGSNAYTDRQMAEKIFGKETVETQNYHFLPIDTTRFPVYHAITKGALALNDNAVLDRIKDKITAYYTELATTCDGIKLDSLLPYVQFLKDFAGTEEFSFIGDYLESYGNLLGLVAQHEAKVSELDAPTVND